MTSSSNKVGYHAIKNIAVTNALTDAVIIIFSGFYNCIIHNAIYTLKLSVSFLVIEKINIKCRLI
jgi:hypothetical protein